jgi:hypothetical protein
MAKNKFKDLFDQANAAFNGEYADELAALHGLSKEEIDSVTPGTTDLATYSVLLQVVTDASTKNLSQAELITNIKSLGDVAVKIARKVPQFAALL